MTKTPGTAGVSPAATGWKPVVPALSFHMSGGDQPPSEAFNDIDVISFVRQVPLPTEARNDIFIVCGAPFGRMDDC